MRGEGQGGVRGSGGPCQRGLNTLHSCFYIDADDQQNVNTIGVDCHEENSSRKPQANRKMES